MNLSKIFVSLSVVVMSGSAWAYGTGYSSFPLSLEKRLIATEITGITSNGGGLGVQARYTQKANEQLSFDAGLGMGAGERSGRIFANADYEIFPDYMRQPRFAVRAGYEYAKEFDSSRNIFSVAPTVSKGFSFWGNEAFPFVSLPIGMNLNTSSKTYESSLAFNTGITGHLPMDGYQDWIGSAEMQIDLKDSFTAVFFGISYPIN